RYERHQEDAGVDPRPAPLRPAAEELREGHEEPCPSDDPVDRPVAARVVIVDLGCSDPDEEAGSAGSDQRYGAPGQAMHAHHLDCSLADGMYPPRQKKRLRLFEQQTAGVELA